MFTTIMYGFINEVTRQPASADIPLKAKSRGGKVGTVAHAPGTARRVGNSSRRQRPLASQYRVLADSFKRAAGFH